MPSKRDIYCIKYDLMRAENNSLNEEDRNNLIMSLNTFIESSHHHFINAMLETVNPSYLRTKYNGYQCVPMAFKQNGFKTVVWNSFGSLSTPSFHGKFDESYYRDDQNVHVVLEYPEDFREQVGSGSLVIQLEVDTRDEESWQEGVRSTEVPK